jgi:hypothetical protein
MTTALHPGLVAADAGASSLSKQIDQLHLVHRISGPNRREPKTRLVGSSAFQWAPHDIWVEPRRCEPRRSPAGRDEGPVAESSGGAARLHGRESRQFLDLRQGTLKSAPAWALKDGFAISGLPLVPAFPVDQVLVRGAIRNCE